MGSKQEAIFRTLLYSDLFNCPLREDELFYYLNTKEKVLQKDISKIALQTPGVYKWESWYSLRRSHQDIRKRQERMRISQAKIALAQRLIRWITWIPSLLFVGISGSVAAGNAQLNDDIDFFVITQKGSLYTTRLLLLLLLQILRKRRKPHEQEARNKICLNMLIDESSLAIPESKRTVYTAREIGQLMPLFERRGTYQRFLKANAWAKSFLPHIGRKGDWISSKGKVSQRKTFFTLVEPLTRFIEIRYMKKRQTVEQVNTHSIAFHLNDTAVRILRRYEARLKTLELTMSR
ncbi:MAG: hypothetical protein AAB478_01495 [Patescibacteria group bacterium]